MQQYYSLAEKLTSEALLAQEIAQRTTVHKKPEILHLPPELLGHSLGFFNQGTIITLISQGRTDYVEGLTAAVKEKNAGRIQLHCEAIVERTRRDTLKPPAAGGLDDIPTIVDIQYGNTWLAQHSLLAPHTTLALTASVWSGGALNDNGFTVHEHYKRNTSAANIHVLIVLIAPKLNRIEESLLKAVPAELSEVHVSGPSVAWSAAGLAMQWTPDDVSLRTVRKPVGIRQFFIPMAERVQQYTTVNQRQQQQQDTKQQQQQQQQFATDGQNRQQQQQQQQQEKTIQQQQQQDQKQQQQTDQQQNQAQQQQQAQGEEHAQQQQQHHDAATAQGGFSGYMRDELDGGFVVRPIDEERYASLLSRIDFQSLDATQSVKELLRLRERLLTIGLG